jgi:hypothetical protein
MLAGWVGFASWFDQGTQYVAGLSRHAAIPENRALSRLPPAAPRQLAMSVKSSESLRTQSLFASNACRAEGPEHCVWKIVAPWVLARALIEGWKR